MSPGGSSRTRSVHLREAGVEVTVVSPASFRHFGIAYGDGIANNLRARPWRVLLLPLFLLSFARAARRASRRADVVHAHWLPSAVAALATGKPLVLQAWGSDVELAKRLPWLFRPLLRRARVVVCASSSLAADVRTLGAREVRVIPSGVDIPAEVGAPDEPPHVLYVGRLSEEKGIRELVEAAAGLPLVVVGDGPLRDLVPQAVGFVPHDELGAYYERAAVVVVPSRREGYGVVAREAMAYGRAVVTTGVGRPRRRDRATTSRASSCRIGRCPACVTHSNGSSPTVPAGNGSARPRGRRLEPSSAFAAATVGHDRTRYARRARRSCSARASASTRIPSNAVSFLPSSRDRAA